jgi:Trk K+ transport system NAD-binding subunit
MERVPAFEYGIRMYVIITGCGRLGAGVAKALAEKGHDVVVVDERADPRLLGEGFDGLVVDGSPTDQEVLILAGIRKADLLVAATSDDRRNILTVQIAKASFGVPKAIARISDPSLASFYRSQNMSTVCPTSTGINQVIATIQEVAFDSLSGFMDPNIAAIVAPHEWIGLTMGKLPPGGNRRVLGLVSKGRVHQWEPGRVIAKGDSILLARGGRV